MGGSNELIEPPNKGVGDFVPLPFSLAAARFVFVTMYYAVCKCVLFVLICIVCVVLYECASK